MNLEKKEHTNLFLVFAILSVVCLIVSNIASYKIIQLPFNLTITSSVFLFVITYILNDLLTEVYGYKNAKKVILIGFAMNLLAVLYFQFTILLPSASFFVGDEAYTTVLSNTPRMLLASFSAYLVGSIINAKIMDKMRNRKSLFARCVTSTFFGELFDSIIFVCIAFMFVYDINTILIMVLVQTVFKTLYEIVAFPLTNIVIKKVKKLQCS